ncbi:polysaccharide deacetylase family protein [bacterium]|nr:polysaccharide deacetylase family protein [bacterium]
MKIACINVDVDPLICYYAIHGIETSGISEDPIYLKGIRRFIELFDKNSIKGTFFITSYGFTEKNSEILREIVRSGHEIADHSFSHNYQLTRLSKDEIFQEIKKNKDFLEDMSGIVCKGFRSPGYNSSADLISVLKSVGYTYDSSLFPSISYYLAKWFLIHLKKLSGHGSKSIISSFADAFGRYTPEFIDKTVSDTKKDGTFVELPMTTLFPLANIPLIGTSIIAFPAFLLEWMLQISKNRSFINIEAHGIDLCGADESQNFDPLKGKQPDLAFSLERKIERFQHVIDFYKNNGFTFKTLCEVAEMKLKGTIK